MSEEYLARKRLWYKLALLLFITGYFELVKPECFNTTAGLYCTNLVNNDSESLIFKTKDEIPNYNVNAVYLRNCSGGIDKSTFSKFPSIESLDIQLSNIDTFLPESTTLHTLYIMHNKEFPKFTAEFMNNCCKHFIILFIVGNAELEIEPGTFKGMENLTHLTISSQNISHLTKDLLRGLVKLTYLNLKNNAIERIDEDSFEDLTELSHLDLSYNNFKNFVPSTFEKLDLMENLDLYGLNLDKFNISIFSKQHELKHLGVPTSLIKQKLELNQLIQAFPKLEAIGAQNEDREDEDVVKFMKICKSSGFYIEFSNV